MTRFKLSTLSLALLGGLALTACDNNTPDTAAVDTYEPDTTAATEPVEPIDDTTPVAGVDDPVTTDPTMTDPTATDPATMGDVNEYPMEEQDPTAAPEPDPMMDEQQDLEEPVDESEPPQPR